VIVRLEQLDSFGNLSLDLKVSTFTTPSKVIMSCNLCTTVVAPQILIVLFLIYLFDNIIQLISLRNLWYYGGW
jgi:hypothetical protein